MAEPPSPSARVLTNLQGAHQRRKSSLQNITILRSPLTPSATSATFHNAPLSAVQLSNGVLNEPQSAKSARSPTTFNFSQEAPAAFINTRQSFKFNSPNLQPSTTVAPAPVERAPSSASVSSSSPSSTFVSPNAAASMPTHTLTPVTPQQQQTTDKPPQPSPEESSIATPSLMDVVPAASASTSTTSSSVPAAAPAPAAQPQSSAASAATDSAAQPAATNDNPAPAATTQPPTAAASSSSSSTPAAGDTLTIQLNNAAVNLTHRPAFPTNEIITSKYHWWNFLPLNLFSQFRRFANLFFLVVTILQGIPIISPFPIYTSLVPLVFILAVSAAKEAVEDYGRHKADDKANGREFYVMKSPADIPRQYLSITKGSDASAAATAAQDEVIRRECFRRVTSKHIKVGDILLVLKDEEFPADLMLLSSSASDATALVNTANLDGEAVPKIRQSPNLTMGLTTLPQVAALKGEVVVEKPTASMYRFQGRLQIIPESLKLSTPAGDAKNELSVSKSKSSKKDEHPDLARSESLTTPSKAPQGTPGTARRKSRSRSRRGSKLDEPAQTFKAINGRYQTPLNDINLLLRGSRLAHTQWCYGVVIYTGLESKLMLNRNAASFKFSKFEKVLNGFVIRLFIFNLLACITLAAGTVIRNQDFATYFDIGFSSRGVGFILNLLTQYILFSFMIPMSLYVTIELVKVGQAKFMEWDGRMKYWDASASGGDGDEGEWKSMIVKNSSICEELGNLDYVFSDKTGTLTMNKMELTAVSVGGTLYNDGGAMAQAMKDEKGKLDSKHVGTNGAGLHPSVGNRGFELDTLDALSSNNNVISARRRNSLGQSGRDSSQPMTGRPHSQSLCEVLPTPREHVLHVADGNRTAKIYQFESYMTARSGHESAINTARSPLVTITDDEPESGGGIDAQRASNFNPHATNLPPSVPEIVHQSSVSAQSNSPSSSRVVNPDDILKPGRRPSSAAPPSGSLSSREQGNSPRAFNLAADEDATKTGLTPPSPARTAEEQNQHMKQLLSQAATQTPTSDADVLKTDLVLQDLVNRAFSTMRVDASGNAQYPRDTLELDYLLDLLLCNSIMPLKKKSKSEKPEESDSDDDDSSEEEISPSPDGAAVAVPSTPPLKPRADPQGSPASSAPLNVNGGSSATNTPAQPSKAQIRKEAHKAHDAKFAQARFTFASSSPDEIALCESLDRCGLTLIERKGDHMTIRYVPHASSDFMRSASSSSAGNSSAGPYFFRFRILATLDFTSTRARMAVVLETPDGTNKMFVKGSDQKVMKMVQAALAHSTAGASRDAKSKATIDATTNQLSAFAKTGSRTLLMAGRTLPSAAADAFLNRYDEAANSMANREDLIEAAFESLEKEGLELLGSSAVEDQLQECVPEAVDFLLKGGLKLIILTGDKRETARSIGLQCNCLQSHMVVLEIGVCDSKESVEKLLKENLARVVAEPPTDQTRASAEMARARMGDKVAPPLPPVDPTHPKLGYALLIDGQALEVCLRYYKEEFICLFLHTATIVSYRSTPKQKSLAVQVVKDGLGKTTLAIGDGANDVSMIQTANVGVGILGKEGAHAALSSDYVIHRFIHLIPLMFLHGRYNYHRTAQVVFFSFYKNMVFPFPMIIFSFYSFNSGSVLFIPILMSVYNLLFTSLPPLFTGWYERDHPPEMLLQTPSAYAAFKANTPFSSSAFNSWMFSGLVHGFILWYMMWGILNGSNTGVGDDIFFANGMTAGLWLYGLQIFAAVIILTNLKMLTTLCWITWYNVLASFLGLVALLLVVAIISSSYFTDLAPDAFGVLPMFFKSSITYLYLLLVVVMCYVPSIVISGYQDIWGKTNPLYLMNQAAQFDSQSMAEEMESAKARELLIDLLDRGGCSNSPIPPKAGLNQTSESIAPPVTTTPGVDAAVHQPLQPSNHAGSSSQLSTGHSDLRKTTPSPALEMVPPSRQQSNGNGNGIVKVHMDTSAE